MNHTHSLWLLLLLVVLSFASIPTLQPDNPTLYQPANYIVNYYSVNNFTTTSYFTIDFTASDISVSNSTATSVCLVTINDTTASSATCSCSGGKCTIKPNKISTSSANFMLKFGPLINPPYVYQQKITVFVSFNPSLNETDSVTISSSIYQAMPII